MNLSPLSLEKAVEAWFVNKALLLFDRPRTHDPRVGLSLQSKKTIKCISQQLKDLNYSRPDDTANSRKSLICKKIFPLFNHPWELCLKIAAQICSYIY